MTVIGWSSKNCTVFRRIWLAKRNGINVELNERPEMTPLKNEKFKKAKYKKRRSSYEKSDKQS